MIKVFYFSLKYLISIPYEIGKSGHIISIISCFGEMWCLKKECGFKETLYCTVCSKWFWEMRRIWGLLNEFIKITLPFAPKRWTWETDSICIRARNWWSGLCFSQEQIPDPSRAWDGSLFKLVVSIGVRMVPSHPEDIYLYCISWMGNGNLEATIGISN